MDAQTTHNPLTAIKDHLVELAEDLSTKLEGRLDPNPTLSLEGIERAKADHRFLAQAKKIEAELLRLSGLIDHFQVHAF